MMTDPVADMLTRIKNACNAKHATVIFPASKLKANICKVLKEEGYIRSFKIIARTESCVDIKVLLKENAIVGIKRVSRPGLRVYKEVSSLPRVMSGLGTSVVSTPKGVLSSKSAKKLNVGGEVICNIW